MEAKKVMSNTERSRKFRQKIYHSRSRHNELKEKERDRKNLENRVNSLKRDSDEGLREAYRKKQRER